MKLASGLAIIIVLLISLLFVTGCIAMDGRPPEFSVSNPNVMPDGSGGIIVAYQINNGNGSITCLQRLDVQGKALWNEKGLELGSGTGSFLGGAEAECAPLVSDGRGNIIVVYPSQNGLWAQKLDMEGKALLPSGNQISIGGDLNPVSFRAVSDNSGGAIIGWVEDRDHIRLQTAGGGGVIWSGAVPTPGVDKFDVVSDASGNVFVIWKDNPSYSEGNIFVQKLDSSGQVAWPSGGLLLSGVNGTASVRSGIEDWIVSDSDGGAIAVWVHAVLSENGRLIIGQNLYAQRIDTSGELLWESDGVPIGDKAEQLRVQSEPRVISDGSGGTVIFWKSGVKSIWAQRIDSKGNTLWSENGIEVVQATGSGDVVYYHATHDSSGGTAIVWNYTENGNKVLRAQRLDAGGKKLWGDEGIRVSTIPAYWAAYAAPARISPDGTGGFVISWASGKNIKDKTSSYIQRISADGKLLFGGDGINLNK